MLRIFHKIRKSLLLNKTSEGISPSAGKYMLYAIGEVLLIVIGILIALQIDNWNTERIQKENEVKIYQNIKRQIIDDKNELDGVKNFNETNTAQYALANQIINNKNQDKQDTLAFLIMNLAKYSDFHRSGNIYETLVNSGDLG